MICFCATTRRAARLLTHVYEEALRPAHLTPAQFELLATLAHCPNLSQSFLADVLALDQTTLSRNLKHLLSRELLQRSLSANDRRQTTYVLSPTGSKAFAQALPLWQSAHEQVQETLGARWQPTLDTLTQLSAAAVSIASDTK